MRHVITGTLALLLALAGPAWADVIHVPDEIARDALEALKRMLEVK